jgi:hypothetical protein
VTYRAPTGFDFYDDLPSQTFTGAMSYVTGSHNVKVGMELQRGYFRRGDNNDSTGGIWYRTRDYVPNLVTIQRRRRLAEQPRLQPRHLRAGSLDGRAG